MKNSTQQIYTSVIKTLVFSIICIYLLVGYLVVSWLWEVSHPVLVINTCADAPTYEDAKDALRNGNLSLNPSGDGRPCKTRFPNEAAADKNPIFIKNNKKNT